MNSSVKFLFWVKNFIFPSFCPLCENSFVSAVEIKYGICNTCGDFLSLIKGSTCAICGKSLISEFEICLPCRNTEHNYDRLWALYPYTGKYRKLLTAYKFQKNISLSNFLSQKILDVITDNPELAESVIVPVPPRPGKIKYTGWDQVDHLVKRLKRSKNCPPVLRCLKRRKSKVQKELNRKDRLLNLNNRIYTKGIVPKNILLIDDVTTTGATMEICAKVLKENGAQKVYGLCLFIV